MIRFAMNAFVTVSLAWAMTSLVHAQATRTWVSGVGDDANPCLRTAPCKTFAGAISKTAAKGEISALDPGGFGAVTITKSITISGDGTLAGILASLVNGVIVSAGATDVVILRNISIAGAGNGLNGIRFLAGGQLVVENVTIYGFAQNGIEMSHSGNGDLAVRNSSITGGATGVRVSSPSGHASMHGVAIQGAGNGVDVLSGIVNVSDSIISQNSGFGLLAQGGRIGITNSMLASNGTAVQSQTGAAVRVSNNDVLDNGTAFGCGGGTLASAGNNRKSGNGTVGAPPGCAPNATITMQ